MDTLRSALLHFKKCVEQDLIEQATETYTAISSQFEVMLRSEATSSQQLIELGSMLDELRQIESALAIRQEKIKLLLLPLNQQNQLLDGDIYSGRRK